MTDAECDQVVDKCYQCQRLYIRPVYRVQLPAPSQGILED